MFDPLAAVTLPEDRRLFAEAVERDNDRDRPAHSFFGREAKRRTAP